MKHRWIRKLQSDIANAIFKGNRCEWTERLVYFYKLGSIDISCRIESDEVIIRIFVNKCIRLIDIFKKTSRPQSP